MFNINKTKSEKSFVHFDEQLKMDIKYPTIEPQFKNTFSSLLFKVKFHQIEMLTDRGYDTSDEQMLLTWNVSYFIDTMTDLAKKAEKTLYQVLSRSYYNKHTEKNIYVHFFEREKDGQIKMDTIKNMLTLIKSKNYFDIILISENALNTTNELTLDKFPAYNFEQFNYHTLAINITKHIMVPKHEPLDQTQKK